MQHESSELTLAQVTFVEPGRPPLQTRVYTWLLDEYGVRPGQVVRPSTSHPLCAFGFGLLQASICAFAASKWLTRVTEDYRNRPGVTA